MAAYRDAMERRVAEAARGEAQVPEGWLDDKFVPLGFEASRQMGRGDRVRCGRLRRWWRCTRKSATPLS